MPFWWAQNERTILFATFNTIFWRFRRLIIENINKIVCYESNFQYLHGFAVVTHIEVGVAQLAVDGTQSPEIVGSSL